MHGLRLPVMWLRCAFVEGCLMNVVLRPIGRMARDWYIFPGHNCLTLVEIGDGG